MTTCLNCKATISLRATALMVFFLSLFTACAPNSKTVSLKQCTLDKEHSPMVRGLRLGMTLDEIRAKWPKLERRSGRAVSDVTFVYGDVTEPSDKEYIQIVCTLFHDKLVRIDAIYGNNPVIFHHGEFVDKISNALGLKEQGSDDILSARIWICGGFHVTVDDHALEANTFPEIRIEDDASAQQIKEEENKERQDKIEQFKP